MCYNKRVDRSADREREPVTLLPHFYDETVTPIKLSTEIVRELLDYDPDTGMFAWRSRSRDWFKTDRSWKTWNTRYAGEIAGGVKKNARGYPKLLIKVLSKDHRASRLAFLWMGEVMPEQADHINGNSLENHWANLRSSNNTENQKNRGMSRANTSGVTGVYWHKGSGKWQAQGGLGGKNKHLGSFDDINEAAAAASKFHAANGYTARHGQALSTYQEAAT